MEKKRPKLEVSKYMGKKDLASKGKHIVKIVDQPLINLVWK